MVVIDIPWFKVDDGFANSAAVMRIPRRNRCAAAGLWCTAGSWCAKELTDGFVPDHMVTELGGTKALAGWLVTAGLWARGEGGYWFIDWARDQPTAADVQAKRSEARERMRRARNKNKPSSSDDVRANNARTEGDSSRERVPSDFDVTQSTEARSSLTQASDKARVNHRDDTTENSNAEVEAESTPDVRANFASSDTNPYPTRPDLYIGVASSGDRYVASPRANSDAPPKFHAGHDDGWIDDCDECDATAEAWVAANRVDLRGASNGHRPGRPADRCPKHINDPRPPNCGHCADARRTAEAWDTAQSDRAKRQRSEQAQRAAEDRARAVAECGLCDETGYVGTTLCDHRPPPVNRPSLREQFEAHKRAADAAPTPEPTDDPDGPSSDQPAHQDHDMETHADA